MVKQKVKVHINNKVVLCTKRKERKKMHSHMTLKLTDYKDVEHELDLQCTVPQKTH